MNHRNVPGALPYGRYCSDATIVSNAMPPHIEQGAGTADGARLPSGSRQITNDYVGLINSAGWGGPCPPKGATSHRYNFVLYALKVEKLNLPPNATASHAGFVVNLNALDKATLTMTYGR